MLAYETAYWSQSSGCLAGVDEAGRGCLAGPVVAGAVSIAPEWIYTLYTGQLANLNDSKKLTPLQRDHFFEILTHCEGVHWAIGMCSAEEIDEKNILVATHLAMRRAIKALDISVDHVLVDGLPVKGLPCSSTAIVQGDGKSILIAAASVVAKVSRDRHMCMLHEQYPCYGFNAHKGYGVSEHLAALFRHGSCPEHRHTFRPVQDVDQCLPGFEW